MRTTCIIDNFNHGRFVSAAVESALNQTLAFDEILVIDDASTDQSRQILQQQFGNSPRVKLIFREKNEGQLACLQTGILAATGEICCLLDADDSYHPSYLQTVCAAYEQHSEVDSVFTSSPQLRRLIERPLLPRQAQQTGYSLALVALENAWIGAPTSCLSFRRKCLRNIVPYPHVEDWKVRADDFLNLASSSLGGLKYYCPEDLVEFRWHDQNNSFNCGDPVSTYRRRIALNRMKEWLRQKDQLNRDDLIDDLHREFATWTFPSFKLLGWYVRAAIRNRRRWGRSLAQSASMILHYARSKRLLKNRFAEESSLAYVPHRKTRLATPTQPGVEVLAKR